MKSNKVKAEVEILGPKKAELTIAPLVREMLGQLVETLPAKGWRAHPSAWTRRCGSSPAATMPT